MTDSKDDYQARGGIERAKRLTSEQRSEIARQGAVVRWTRQGKSAPLVATYGAEDRPLRIGSVAIPCYVLADGTRVLAQRGLQSGMGLSEGGGKGGARKIAALMEKLAEKGLDVRGLVARANSPIRFIPPHGGNLADGYDATILPDLCAVLIEADQQGLLGKRLKHLAERAAMLQHGFATVGIIALVDEATGFQSERARDALAEILEAFVVKELRKWIKTFPGEFYQQLFRLRKLPFPPTSSLKRPSYFGHLTNDIVYDRLAPGVKDELKRLTPRDEKGRHKHKLFQRLTENIGHPRLREHLASVVSLMKISKDYDEFEGHLNKAHPKWNETLSIFD